MGCGDLNLLGVSWRPEPWGVETKVAVSQQPTGYRCYQHHHITIFRAEPLLSAKLIVLLPQQFLLLVATVRPLPLPQHGFHSTTTSTTTMSSILSMPLFINCCSWCFNIINALGGKYSVCIHSDNPGASIAMAIMIAPRLSPHSP